MPRIEAIIRTAEQRIRPVLLTTITTMAGLMPMMFGLSLDFFGGGYSIDSPTALWWKQLATAVVFGLGIATVLTLIFTPSMLALRVWASDYAIWIARALAALSLGRGSTAARDWALQREARRLRHPELHWEDLGVAASHRYTAQALHSATAVAAEADLPAPPAPAPQDAPPDAPSTRDSNGDEGPSPAQDDTPASDMGAADDDRSEQKKPPLRAAE
jgi:multidrug efflux pump